MFRGRAVERSSEGRGRDTELEDEDEDTASLDITPQRSFIEVR